MGSPQHHQHIRKRVHQHKEVFPHPHPFKRFIDKAVLIFGVIAPLMTAPQAYRVWVDRQVEGLHLGTWSVYFVNAILFTIYGIIHKDKPIIVMQGLFVLMTGLVSLGIILFQ